MDAQALCARVRQDLADVEERIKGNSWLVGPGLLKLRPAANWAGVVPHLVVG
jgi:hypothetical protein